MEAGVGWAYYSEERRVSLSLGAVWEGGRDGYSMDGRHKQYEDFASASRLRDAYHKLRSSLVTDLTSAMSAVKHEVWWIVTSSIGFRRGNRTLMRGR